MEKREGKNSSKEEIPGKDAQNEKTSRDERENYEKIIKDTAIQMRIMGASYEDSLDISHEAFIHTYEKYLEGNVDNFKSYMFITAKNLLFKILNRNKRFVEDSEDYLFIDIDRNDPLTEFLKKESSVLLLEAISMLPEKYRRIIEMDMMDVPHKKIGEELNISYNSVKVRKNEILKSIQNYFNRTPENYTEDKIARNINTIGLWLDRGEITKEFYDKMLSSLFRKKLILQTIKQI